MFQACLQRSLSRLATLLCASSPPHAHTSCNNGQIRQSGGVGGECRLGSISVIKQCSRGGNRCCDAQSQVEPALLQNENPSVRLFEHGNKFTPPVLVTGHHCGFTGSVWIMYITSAAGARHTSPSLFSSCSANARGLNFRAANVRKRKTNKKTNKINARLSFLPSLHSGSC